MTHNNNSIYISTAALLFNAVAQLSACMTDIWSCGDNFPVNMHELYVMRLSPGTLELLLSTLTHCGWYQAVHKRTSSASGRAAAPAAALHNPITTVVLFTVVWQL